MAMHNEGYSGLKERLNLFGWRPLWLSQPHAEKHLLAPRF